MSVHHVPPSARSRPRAVRFGPDPVGVPLAALLLAGFSLLPFVTLRANRIVPGEALSPFAALPGGVALALALAVVLSGAAALALRGGAARLLAAALLLLTLPLAAGTAPAGLVAEGDRLARVSLGGGFWLLLAAGLLLAIDALTRLRPGPLARLALLALALAALGAALASGHLDGLSVMREHATRADGFRREVGQHLRLAFGALLAALLLGVPLGVLAHRAAALRGPLLALFNVFQTIPSIALFALLIGPLGFLAATLPGAEAIGIRGIGAAPAFVALVLYSLLPVTANTLGGLAEVPATAREAARGCGMTRRQSLLQVELPLALPAILAAVRIVLVQNIGLATVAALIGGGGLGVFVFQGIGQTAMDLVLLGVVPIVALCLVASVALGALVDLVSPASGRTVP